jgi:hypothetical protein
MPRNGHHRQDIEDDEPNAYSQRAYGATVARNQLRLVEKQALETQAGRAFEAIVARVSADLGGADQLTEIEKHLVTSFAGAALLQGRQLSRILKGEKFNNHEYVSVSLAMIRASKRLGTKRQVKEVTPSPLEYARRTAE